MLEIKQKVLESNKDIVDLGLVIGSFGNASQRYNESILIKPSGVKIDKIIADDIVCVNTKSGKYSGEYKPSTDTPTHIELYNHFPEIGGIVHTHSMYATAWAQSCMSIPCLGTTHGDYWNGDVPITRRLNDDEINKEYEKETGKVIIEKIKELQINPLDCPGILVSNHGPFAWGSSIEDAVKNAETLEYVAKLAWLTIDINPNITNISNTLLGKHFSRKHGQKSYYGQEKD